MLAEAGEPFNREAEPVSSRTARVVTSLLALSCVVDDGSIEASSAVLFFAKPSELAAGSSERLTGVETVVCAL